MTLDTALVGLSEGLIDLAAKVGQWAIRRFLGERDDGAPARLDQRRPEGGDQHEADQRDVNPARLETPGRHDM
jgi:hypothetical protein